jgi:TPR repeat protein
VDRASLEREAAAGSRAAQNELGSLLAADPATAGLAVEWFRRAAEQGEPAACANLGRCYTEAIGVERNAVERLRWYRRAAELGDVGAANDVGVALLGGLGCERDVEEALAWFRRAAEGGDVLGMFNLGALLEDRRDDEAVMWYARASDLGCAPAMNNLALIYQTAPTHIEDLTAAFALFREAARMGFAAAEWNLGRCFERGLGIGASPSEAHLWYTQAAARGYHGPATTSAFAAIERAVDEPLGRNNIVRYRFGPLPALHAEERPKIAALLRARLDGGDGRAALALVDLALPEAGQFLEQALERATPEVTRLFVAAALLRLTDSAAALAVLGGGLQHARVGMRELTARLLQQCPASRGAELLLSALDDVEPDVRALVVRSLIAQAGLRRWAADSRSLLGYLPNRAASPLGAVRSAAAEELRTILRGIADGKQPAELLLDQRVDEAREPIRAFLAALRSSSIKTLVVGNFAEGSFTRRWVEDVLITSLANDARAARALASLQVSRARPALADAAQSATDVAVREAAASALARLKR